MLMLTSAGLREIDVYEISDNGYEFLETLELKVNRRKMVMRIKITPKLQALNDCTIVYVVAIGGSAAARLIKKSVTPVKAKSEEEKIEDILNKLVKTLKGNPSPLVTESFKSRKNLVLLKNLKTKQHYEYK